jgi:hypothetical protein
LIETKLFIGGYMKIPQDTSVFYIFPEEIILNTTGGEKTAPHHIVLIETSVEPDPETSQKLAHVHESSCFDA